MKRWLLICCALVPFGAGAQDFSVLQLRPASPEGKLITVEDATYGRCVRAAGRYYSWEDDATMQYSDRDSIHHIPLAGGEETVTPRPLPGSSASRLPRGAANAVSTAGHIAYTLDDGVYVEADGVLR